MRFQILLLSLLLALFGCKIPKAYNIPPAERLMHPGPGVDGPGPGVIAPEMPPPGGGAGMSGPTSQLAFVGPEGMSITWDVSSPGAFDSEPIIAPGRYNFPQAAIYRLKLTSIPGRPGVELYPTIEVAPAMPRSEAYLAHNAIPVQFTEEDFDQVLSGNFVTKVIYLPDAEFQELAIAGVETLVSTRLDPGVDPIIEADRLGSILAIVRIGNKDLQVPGDEGQMVGGGGDGSMSDLAMAGGVMCASGTPMGPGAGDAGFPIAGVNAPQWGMPISGTPIGLPGPPHVPFGVQAGLQKHVIKNHTHMKIPGPTHKVRIDVKQKPGMSYPKPASHAWITEHAVNPMPIFSQPCTDKCQGVPTMLPAGCPVPCPPGGAEVPCPPEG